MHFSHVALLRVAAFSTLLAISSSVLHGQEKPPADNGDAQPQAVQLVRPGALTGWEHGPKAPTGWKVDGQTLAGSEGGPPLVSGWTFGDFTLRFDWRAKDKGELQVRLLDVPEGGSLNITLSDDDKCGEVSRDGKVLAKGQHLKKRKENDARRQVEIVRAGEKLRLNLDREVVTEFKIPGDGQRRFGLGFHVPRGEASLENLAVTEPLGGPIFNGEDLTGWWSQRKKDSWFAEDGMLATKGKGGNYLRSEKLYGNYTFSFQYKIKPGGNSGVGIRTPREGWPSRDGMELQILDRPGKSGGSQMSIYKYFPPLERPDNSGEWNRVVIKADGRMITVWVNGQIAQHANTATHDKLADRPLEGWVGFQDHGAKIRIRDVHLLEAPAGLGLAAWYPEPAPPAVEADSGDNEPAPQ